MWPFLLLFIVGIFKVNKLNSEIGMVAVVRAIAASMGLPKPAVVSAVEEEEPVPYAV